VLAGLGVFVVLEARRWEYLGPDGPGPGFFPWWYGVCMIALAVLLVATSVRARAREPRARTDWGEIARALAAWAGLTACIGLLKILGFLLAFGLFTFFLVAVMYRRPPATALAVSVGIAVVFYLLFPVALNVALPVGKLGF
jgi:putative tricarboxylic transport membrane protein